MDLSMYINKFSLEIRQQEHSYLSCLLFSDKQLENNEGRYPLCPYNLPVSLVGISEERQYLREMYFLLLTSLLGNLGNTQ